MVSPTPNVHLFNMLPLLPWGLRVSEPFTEGHLPDRPTDRTCIQNPDLYPKPGCKRWAPIKRPKSKGSGSPPGMILSPKFGKRETILFFISWAWRGAVLWHLVGRGQGRCSGPTVHRAALTARNHRFQNVSSVAVGEACRDGTGMETECVIRRTGATKYSADTQS